MNTKKIKIPSKIDQYWQFKSLISKTGMVLLLMSAILTIISFSKGIQVLMFVPAFICSLFLYSGIDIFWRRKNLKIIHQKQEIKVLFKKNLNAYFFNFAALHKKSFEIKKRTKKLTIKKEIWELISPNKNLEFDIPQNSTQIIIQIKGRLDIFRKNILLSGISSKNEKQKTSLENIEIELKEYQEGDLLENIDPIKSSLSDKIFIRNKYITTEKKDLTKKTKKNIQLSSRSPLENMKSIQKGVAAEIIMIFIGFIGSVLQWGGVIFPLFFILSAVFIWRKKAPLHKKWLNPIALVLFFGSITEGFIQEDPALSGVHFLLSLAIWKHAFERERRDGITYIILILFVFVALSLFTLSAWFLFLFLGFLMISASLFSLFAGGETPDEYTARIGTPYNKKFFIHYILTLFVFTFLFFLILPHGNQGKDTSSLLAKKNENKTGFSEQVSLKDVQQIKQDFSKKIVIENTEESKVSFYQNLYFTGARFISFNGEKWERYPLTPAPFENKNNQISQSEKIRIKTYTQGGRNIFMPFIPIEIKGEKIFTAQNDPTVFYLAKNAGTDFFLDIKFLTDENNQWKQRKLSPLEQDKIIKVFNDQKTKVDPETLKVFEPFIKSIPEQYQSSPKKISEYIESKAGFSYSLNNPADNISDFLYHSKQGHCEYFATTLAVTLQYFGYNATVVNGFKGGEWNSQASAFIIRNQNAHSWVEIFQNEQWIKLDPTPSIEQGNEMFWFQKIPLLPHLINFYDAIEIRWNRFFVEFTGEKQKQFFIKVFSYWPYFLAVITIFIIHKLIFYRLFKWWKKRHTSSNREKFIDWMKSKNLTDGFFLSKIEKDYPQLVKDTREFLFSPKNFSPKQEKDIHQKWINILKKI